MKWRSSRPPPAASRPPVAVAAMAQGHANEETMTAEQVLALWLWSASMLAWHERKVSLPREEWHAGCAALRQAWDPRFECKKRWGEC